MKIQLIDASTKKPLANTTVSLQIKDAGTQRFTTDGTGFINVKDELKGKQVSPSNSQGQWYTLSDNLKLTIEAKQTERSDTSHR